MSEPHLVVDIETTSLQPHEGRIICICAKDTTRNRTYTFQADNEEEMLRQFIDFHQAREIEAVIGYNVLFDIRYLFARCLLHQINGQGFFQQRYEDLMSILKSVGYRYSTNDPGSLEDWTKLLFNEDKLLRNENVPQLYEQGETERICQYCHSDVELTSKLWNRIQETTEVEQF